MSRSRRGRKSIRRCYLWDIWDNRAQTANVERRTLELMLPTDPAAWRDSDAFEIALAVELAEYDASIREAS